MTKIMAFQKRDGFLLRFYFDKKLGVMINDSYQYEPSYIRIRNYKNKYIESGEMKDILLRNLKKQCANL